MFGVKSERVYIYTSSRDVGVVLVRLDQVEVRAKAFRETIMTVKKELTTEHGVATSVAGSKTSVISTTGSHVVDGGIDARLIVVGQTRALGLVPARGRVVDHSRGSGIRGTTVKTKGVISYIDG